ncbi:hypothetical protein CENSYa_1246 [Cenarchaeum symbiosum A]|uniref:Uncharacterized protein n=1 Tax=Cenarchaeum symbiosum (strain A) TaxID=414004 RepID=A0RX02_CENSY|nr:hypothetical protein CENSYa_1246 [Cenarchaeum symbiosum A]
MDEIRGLPEVEAFHEMYGGRDIVFTNYSMNPVEFDYAASDDNRSAYLIIRYYDREPSDFSHQCSDKVLRRGLFMEDSVRTDCFSYVATDVDAP